MPRNTYQAVLQGWEDTTPNVRHFTFRREDGERLPFIPGQFVMIHFSIDGEEWQRSYSIASLSNLGTTIEISVSYVEGGRASRFLWGLKNGARVTMSGPYGRFVLRDRDEPKRFVLVGTGTGCAPYRAMLADLSARLEENPDLSVVICEGVRTPEDVLYPDDFCDFAEEHPKAEFRVCLSRAMPEEGERLHPFAIRGYVQTQFEGLALNPDDDIVYLCGNPNMVDAAVAMLKEGGFSPRQIRREKYIS